MKQLLAGLLLLTFFSCDDASGSDDEPENTTATPSADFGANGVTTGDSEDIIATVETVTATTSRLPMRRRTNGLLRARRLITVKAFSGGLLTTAPQEGQYYRRNDLLLATDTREARIRLDAAEAARDEADYRHRELLLRMRNAAGTDTLTAIQAESMLLQSGLPAAEVAVREAELQLERLQVFAPFAGRVADVKVQPGDRVNPGEEICTLIDLASLEAEFNLLESELSRIGPDSRCTVSPDNAPGLLLPATIDIINPTVDEGGLLRVRARLHRIPKGTRLYPGMNVTVTIEDRAPLAVVVPKAAVVIRSGRELVFVYNPDTGRTEWRYVTILHENDESVALGEGVSSGEQVIVSGNLTLDHDIPVRHVE